MSQELGKIEKPPAEDFRAGRKLYFVPLVFPPREPPADLAEIIGKYWQEVDSQVAGLEVKLGNVGKIYHELVPVGGEDGAKSIEELNQGSYRVVKDRLARGAQVQPIEDGELLTEFMDWGKCLAAGLQNHNVFDTVYEKYREAQRHRNEHAAKQIDATLQASESGILLMREGHQLQFASDIQVFYVAPPALDEIKRWIRQRETQATEAEAQVPDDQEPTGEAEAAEGRR